MGKRLNFKSLDNIFSPYGISVSRIHDEFERHPDYMSDTDTRSGEHCYDSWNDSIDIPYTISFADYLVDDIKSKFLQLFQLLEKAINDLDDRKLQFELLLSCYDRLNLYSHLIVESDNQYSPQLSELVRKQISYFKLKHMNQLIYIGKEYGFDFDESSDSTEDIRTSRLDLKMHSIDIVGIFAVLFDAQKVSANQKQADVARFIIHNFRFYDNKAKKYKIPAKDIEQKLSDYRKTEANYKSRDRLSELFKKEE